MASSGFFEGAEDTDASKGRFNQVKGEQINTSRKSTTDNIGSNNQSDINNTNSNNKGYVKQDIGELYDLLNSKSVANGIPVGN